MCLHKPQHCYGKNLNIKMESHFSPREIVSELDKFIIGQTNAKKSVAIALRNRWRRKNLTGSIKDEILPNTTKQPINIPTNIPDIKPTKIHNRGSKPSFISTAKTQAANPNVDANERSISPAVTTNTKGITIKIMIGSIVNTDRCKFIFIITSGAPIINIAISNKK